MANDFGKEVRELWGRGEEADKTNRKEAMDDLKFAAGEQWDDRVRQYRENGDRPFPLPCLTINTLPQFIGQVVGDRRANQTSIKVLPRENGDKKVAEVRSELIRSIELQSKAERIYTQSFEQAVTCGIGNLRVDLDYAYEDAFERDLFIRGIPNPLAVLWDPLASDPTARDAMWCFVSDRITRAEYAKRFPKAADPSLFDTELVEQNWIDDSTVRLAEYWRIEERKRTIAMMIDGTVQDITGKKPGEVQLFIKPDGNPQMREAMCKYAVRVLTNGQEELDDPYELKLPRLPIVRAMGREVWIGDKRVRFGLTRFARDPQRLKNYWRSVVAELLMGAPRANYMAAAAAVTGRTKDWPNTLTYNDGAEAPREVTGTNLAAIINEAAMCAQDMKDTTGLHDASLGMRSNEQSGVAIQRRQHEGDIATIGYHDNMNAAMQEVGEICNALIPIVYDTPRTIRVIGQDDAVRLLRVNDPEFQPNQLVKENIDLAMGKYDVTISTGPTYMTKRQEASTQLMELARGNAGLMEAAGDLIMKSLDIPGGDELAERLKPQGLVDETEEMTPEQMQAKAEAEAMKQKAQQMEMEAAEAELELKKGQARKANAEADRAESEAEKANIEVINLRAEMTLKGAEFAGMATGEIPPEMQPQPEMEPA
jgi:Phage P22-like portal protein